MNDPIKITSTVSLLKSENLLLIRGKKSIDTVKIEPQLSLILTEFILLKNQVITKKHLIDRVWEGNMFVGNNALRKNIYKLRTLIKELHLDREVAIITIPKKGYKFTVLESKQTFFPTERKWMVYAAASLILFMLALRVFTESNTDYTKDHKMLVQEDIEVEEVLYK
jgi:DNA-binding winged helix-turn-helix (wHTH) protein